MTKAFDTERLDWIARQGDEFSSGILQDCPGDGDHYVSGTDNAYGTGKTFREAIDNARGVPPCEPLRHSTKENGDCPSWCKACAAEAAARGVQVCPKGKGECAKVSPDKRCFACPVGEPWDTPAGVATCANCGQPRDRHLPAGQCVNPGGTGWWHPAGVALLDEGKK